MNNTETFTEANQVNNSLTYCRFQIDITKETLKLIETFCFGTVSTLLCLFGIPANFINCHVFYRQGLKEGINLCLFSLSLADSLYLICMFAMYSVSSFIRMCGAVLSEEYRLKTVVSLVGISNGFRLTSSFITMVIAVERCLGVVFPLHANVFLKTRYARIVTVLSFVLFQICYILYPFMHCPTLIQIEGEQQWTLTPTQLFQETKVVVGIIGNTLLGLGVPVANYIIVLSSTLITVIKLRSADAWRKSSSSTCTTNGNQQVAVTKMLVVSSWIYVVTTMPFVCKEAMFWIANDCLTSDGAFALVMMINAMVESCQQVNSSVHIFVYFFRSSRYRRVIKSGLCVLCNRSRNSNYIEK